MNIKAIIWGLVVIVTIPIASNAQTQLNGAGATFPAVIYSKWFDEYKNMTGILINYQAIGSGGGIKQIIEGTVDFGASDGPMTDQQLNEAKSKQGTDILHIPMVMGGVVISYNLPGIGKGLNLDGETIANIYSGKISKWNDQSIKGLNPKLNLPNRAILAAHRSDGSGTTFIFTDYLSKVSQEWAKRTGKGTSVNWPVGLGGKGNDGVAGLVKQLQGSIGYVELAYAIKNNIPYANIKNKEGNFVEATFSSVSAAAEGSSKNMPGDLRVSITDAPGKDSYPITGFTWLLVYKNMRNETKAKALVNFLKWAMGKGQTFATNLYYAPLSKGVIELCEGKINMITANGKKIK
ncbi:MAG: phosphate ABC transporter substrate-binding protein PstS [Ignavibacteriaceae bacterium]|nr:phosphate ABC transporter substrate-binding protein PstS [Ignavibacteriaceae bacterium]